jgi:CRP-like cAMP-binding protein
MSVDQPKVIDFVGIDKANGEVVLTISDHMGWEKSRDHQLILQNKINSYLAFVESGEIHESYPDSKGRHVVINVVFKYKPDQEGWRFLARAKDVIESAGFSLRHEVFAESYDN